MLAALVRGVRRRLVFPINSVRSVICAQAVLFVKQPVPSPAVCPHLSPVLLSATACFPGHCAAKLPRGPSPLSQAHAEVATADPGAAASAGGRRGQGPGAGYPRGPQRRLSAPVLPTYPDSLHTVPWGAPSLRNRPAPRPRTRWAPRLLADPRASLGRRPHPPSGASPRASEGGGGRAGRAQARGAGGRSGSGAVARLPSRGPAPARGDRGLYRWRGGPRPAAGRLALPRRG